MDVHLRIIFCFLLTCSSEMAIYILEKSVMGGTRRLLAADVYMFLQNATKKVITLQID